MPFSNYTELQALVASYLARSDLTTEIVDFIRLAEIHVQNALELPRSRKTATGTAATANIAFPADFLEAVNLKVGDFNVDIVARATWEDVKARNATSGQPRAAVITSQIELAPTPSGSPAYTLDYWAGIPALSGGNPSNHLLATYPELLLFGALLESDAFLQIPAQESVWYPHYERHFRTAKRKAFRVRTGGGPLRIRAQSTP